MSNLPNPAEIYPVKSDKSICYLKNCVKNPNIEIGDFTFYHDINNPLNFERNNVLYQYPCNEDKLIIGKFCSIATGTKFIFNAANHSLKSLSTYPFPLFLDDNDYQASVTNAWDNKGDIVIGNDVWLGYESVIIAGVTIGDGAIIGTRALVTKDVEPYTIVGGTPAKPIRKRFDEDVIVLLQKIKWWNWDMEKIKKIIPLIQSGNVEELKKLI